jgi:integrase
MNLVQPIRDTQTLEELKQYFKNQSDRNYVMFMLGIYTGLRISDILELQVKDVAGDYISMREKKTSKQKRIIIVPALKRILRDYIKDKPRDEYLIKSQKGMNRPIHRSSAYRILKDAAEEFHLEEIGTHTLRKTFGYYFYQQTKDVAMLQELFNHHSPKVTLRYIGVNQDSLDKAMLRFKI